MKRLRSRYRNGCIYLYFKQVTFLNNYPNIIAAAAGISILFVGLSDFAVAQSTTPAAKMNDERITCAVWQLLSLTEGNFGALMMTIAGISTIIASAFGAFRAATSLLVVACASFTLKSFIEIFFDLGTPNSSTCEWKSSTFSK